MINDNKDDIFLFWNDRTTWNELTQTWIYYETLDYYLLDNEDK